MSRNFAGGTDAILTASNVAFNNGATTFSCWAILTGSQVTRCVFRVGAGSGASFGAYCNSGPFAILLNGTVVNFSSGAFSQNVWHHFAATGTIGSSVAWSFFQDGVAAGSSSATTVAATNNTVKIGGDAFSQPWIGSLADMAWWNAILTPLEIAALAAGSRPSIIRPLSQILWYPLDGIQSPEPDLSGNANNGTLTGTSLAFGPPLMPIAQRWLSVPFTLPSVSPLMAQIVT